MKKKWFAAVTSVMLVGSLLIGCGGTEDKKDAGQAKSEEGKLEKQLVVAGNGATVEKLMKDEIFKKFNEKFPDVKLTYVSGVSTEIVAKVKAQKNAPQIDVVVVEGGEQEAGRKEDLWETLDEKEIPNIAKVSDDLKVTDNSGVTVNFTPMGISYNAELVKEKGLPIPESWNDLARPEMKDNLSLTEVTSNFGRSTLIMLAYANGGSEKQIDPGFDKLNTIAGYMPTFAKSAAQLEQSLQDQTAVYTTWTMARSLVQKEAGLPIEFVFPKEGANIVPNVAAHVKGAKNEHAAKQFIDFLLSDDVQKLYGEALFYNPATSVELSDDVAEKLAFDRDKVVTFDYGAISTHMSEWLDRFNKETATKMGK
ncbi:ABC transporter substrate-binding protein [Numidum massiliense]|uniref:ABC transporter substrate-binding protein n=1 Tax=Numidum massiliense TaxID=1522315 RepID=UPI0006D585FC|nr:ABC transporter substrate-binding protein [Numidum massiliense]